MSRKYQKPSVEDDDERTKRHFLSKEEFDRALDNILPRPSSCNVLKTFIRDNEFVRIGEILRLFGKGEWSLRPRTFSILRMLGCIEAMDGFVSENRTDIYLPYTENNLPKAIKGTELRAQFIQLQEIVLSQQGIVELEEGKKHIPFHSPADDYFGCIGELGFGKFGTVDHVYSILSLREYARKRINRGSSSMKDKTMLESFEKDLAALKSLSHHRHIVKLVGSYTDPFYVGLIMSPVADMNLWEYLTSNRGQNVHKQYLRTFFGCLSSALHYLHSNRVQHKDIKPQNVLVKGTTILLTDFGTARVWEEGDRTTTEGPVSAYTPRYSAPEVADNYPRNNASDIWSLGCVFLEMATVHNDRTLAEMKEFYSKTGTQAQNIYQNTDATQAWIKLLAGNVPDENTEPLKWTSWMLKASREDRPTSSQVLNEIVDHPASYMYICKFCLSDGPSVCSKRKSTIPRNEGLSNGKGLGRRMPIAIEGATRICEGTGTVTAELLGFAERSSSNLSESQPGKAPENEAIVKQAEVGNPPPPYEEVKSELKTLLNESHEKKVNFLQPLDLQDIKIQICEAPLCQRRFFGSESRETHYQQDHPELVSTGKPPVQKNSRGRRISRESSPSNVGRVRFGILPVDQRPEPSSLPVDEQEEVADDLIAEQLKSPPLRQKDCLPLPRASMAPSYILAGTNRFTGHELKGITCTPGLHNLFVYGRLMFPSVLQAVAAKSTQGVYSSLHQRRLYPTSTDWAKADTSIKRAAEIMTPALLKGYDRWRPISMDCAAVQDSRFTSRILRNRGADGYAPIKPEPPGEVVGFVILGLTEEALRYCDVVFTSDHKSLKLAKPSRKAQKEGSGSDTRRRISTSPEPADRPLRRQLINVEVELISGKTTTVNAMTYVWSHGAIDLRSAWYEEKFIRGRSMGRLLGDDDGWKAEEHALAMIMKIKYALPGDYLYGAIVREDTDELERLLEDGYDPNTPCRIYGFPLQAAAALGHEDMVCLLLNFGANANARGGRFETPLLAASHCGHKRLVRILLKNGADVFIGGGKYVSPLYQAVGHSDQDIAEMLLERGAWLGNDYRELLDLASERRDRDMKDLLLDYDVSDLRRKRIAPAERRLDRDGQLIKDGKARDQDLVEMAKVSSKVLMTVVTKFMVLQSQRGSWRGRKGVVIARAAIEAGAPPVILECIRGAVNPVMKLIESLREADLKQQQEQRKATEEREGQEGGEKGLSRRDDRRGRDTRKQDVGKEVMKGLISTFI